MFSFFGLRSLFLSILDFKNGFYTSKFTPGSNPGVWEPKFILEIVFEKKGSKTPTTEVIEFRSFFAVLSLQAMT